ncbi:hypothetical protein V6N13_001761 [Hibiscus sabdariffa]
MQHIPTTVEEQLFLKAVKEECRWENLPKRLQPIFNSKDEWHRSFHYLTPLAFSPSSVIEHCIKKRLQWNNSFARKLFPYYLAEYVCRVMRVSPFRYYCDMIFDLMRNGNGNNLLPFSCNVTFFLCNHVRM